jgi:hypothetical protein
VTAVKKWGSEKVGWKIALVPRDSAYFLANLLTTDDTDNIKSTRKTYPQKNK